MSDAIMEAPVAPAVEPAATPGPKEFAPSRSSAAKPTLREAFEAKAAPDPSRKRVPEPVSQAALPTPPLKKEDKAAEAKPGDKPAEAAPEPKLDAKGEKLPPGRPIKPTAQETWKTLKSRAEQAEAKVKDYESNRVPEQERTMLTQRMEQIQRRNEELENHIRFKDYAQSTEFTEKFHTPYVDALGTAMRDLSRIPVVDEATGTQRAATEQDLFELMNLDPVKQIEAAEAKFGPRLAQRVINHADKVRDVLLARNKALDESKVKGKEREQQMSEQTTRQLKQFEGKVREWYTAAETEWNKDPDAKLFDTITREDGKELTPDEIEHNKLVEKGKELSKWVSKHPRNAKTPEEAAEIVRRQFAILKRAIHFAPLRRLYKVTAKKLAAAEAELAQIRGTTPTTAGRAPTTNGNGRPGQAPKSSVRGMFDKYAGR